MKTQEWQQSSLVRVTEEVDAGSGKAVVAVINCHIDCTVVALSSRSGLHATRGRIRTIFRSLRQGNDLQIRVMCEKGSSNEEVSTLVPDLTA